MNNADMGIHQGNFAEFKRQYRKACMARWTSFKFEGHDILVGYAKYVIEFLEPMFGGKNERR